MKIARLRTYISLGAVPCALSGFSATQAVFHPSALVCVCEQVIAEAVGLIFVCKAHPTRTSTSSQFHPLPTVCVEAGRTVSTVEIWTYMQFVTLEVMLPALTVAFPALCALTAVPQEGEVIVTWYSSYTPH